MLFLFLAIQAKLNTGFFWLCYPWKKILLLWTAWPVGLLSLPLTERSKRCGVFWSSSTLPLTCVSGISPVTHHRIYHSRAMVSTAGYIFASTLEVSFCSQQSCPAAVFRALGNKWSLSYIQDPFTTLLTFCHHNQSYLEKPTEALSDYKCNYKWYRKK